MCICMRKSLCLCDSVNMCMFSSNECGRESSYCDNWLEDVLFGPQTNKTSWVGGACVSAVWTNVKASDSSWELPSQTEFGFIFTFIVNKSVFQMKS